MHLLQTLPDNRVVPSEEISEYDWLHTDFGLENNSPLVK